MSDLLANARRSRASLQSLDSVLVVIGDRRDGDFWGGVLREAGVPGTPEFWVERGRKGNLLGALQAFGEAGVRGTASSLDQIVMLFGSGTRLSPFTQSLRNMKASFPLPDADRGAVGLTMAEAALRSSSLWIECLRAAGFPGVLLTWGDEVLIPSVPLAEAMAHIEGADVVRFGSQMTPTAELAPQKEWLQVDVETRLVVRDISRQPLDQLEAVLRDSTDRSTTTFVNLGSFAASHLFLELASEVFAQHLGETTIGANWDPYFWQAVQCADAAAWQAIVDDERRAGLTGATELLAAVPDFFELVEAFRMRYEQAVGRPLRITAVDLGAPYWIDVGNHDALSRSFAELFADSEGGAALRAFLGLPDALAHGGSYVVDSAIHDECVVENSIVIGSSITDPDATVSGSVILGSRLGHVIAGPGTSLTWCRSDDVVVEGPGGMALRFRGDDVVIAGDESVSTLLLGDRSIDLRFARGGGRISREVFDARLPGNVVSFAEASTLVEAVDPIDLYDEWRSLLGGDA